MSDLANTFDAIARNALLQSTIIFLIGMLIARFAVRRPARVHTVLALSFLAAIVAPLASEAVRRVGWGVLPPEPVILSKQTTASAPSAPKPSHDEPRHDPMRSMTQPGATETGPRIVETLAPDVAGPGMASRSSDAGTFSPATPVEPVISKPASAMTTSAMVVTTAALAWVIASAILLMRLLAGVIAGRRLLRSAARCDEPAVHAALAAARDRLGMNQVRVDVFQFSTVRCPMIWCWAPRPQLLLPVVAARDWSAAAWTPVLCHELAHWKRRDHWAALIAEAVCCLMPWQVLAWWAKRRLENASEQACDDWTVAVGHSAVDYAETLLGLVAQADPPLALAALRRRSGLAGRIQHILTQGMPHPRLGRLWAVAVLLFAVISVGVAAVCQRGVARADAPPPAASADVAKKTDKSEKTKPSDKPKPDDKAQPAAISPGKPAAAMPGKSTASPGETPIPPVAPADLSDELETSRIAGKVVTTDGKPIADAEVFWDIFERPLSNRGDWPGPTTMGQARTGADGAFSMEVKFSRKRYNYQSLAIRAAGYGLRAYQGKELMGMPIQPVEIRLEPSLPIEGSIFTPDGVPVAGARVTLAGMQQGSDDKENWNGWHLSFQPAEYKSDETRVYWPAAVVTDGQGKFRMEDVAPRRATADLRIAAPDYPATAVSVRLPDSLPYNLEVVHRDSPFMLVLEQPYIVNGRFLDETTGEPIANVRMESQPYSNNGISAYNNDTIKAVSDADGRYTLRVGSADRYFVKAFPPLGYPSVQNSISARQINQLAGADRTLDYVLKLRKGIVLKGRVVDAESGEAVANAQVHYKPEKGRKLGVNDDFFPVTTADDGTFEATAVDGKGFFLVDAPESRFYRLAVRDSRVGMYREGLYPHGMIEIDVPAEGQPEPFVIPLKRGLALSLRILAPDGTPVQQFRAACAESNYEAFFNGEEFRDGVFRLSAAEPGRKYRVFINCEKAKAGGVFEVEAPADGKPIDVTLQPWATIRGRYVYDGGAPAPEISNFTRFRLYPDKEPEGNAQLNLPFYDNFSGHQHTKRVTDADGNFELDGIIPGAFIYLNLNNEFAGRKRNYEIGILKAGEVKDVGELVIHANR